MRSVTGLSYAEGQILRRTLIARGVDPHTVSATPTPRLQDLECSTRLTIVTDIEDAPETRDERFSTYYFRARMRGETPDIPTWFGSDDFGGAA